LSNRLEIDHKRTTNTKGDGRNWGSQEIEGLRRRVITVNVTEKSLFRGGKDSIRTNRQKRGEEGSKTRRLSRKYGAAAAGLAQEGTRTLKKCDSKNPTATKKILVIGAQSRVE